MWEKAEDNAEALQQAFEAAAARAAEEAEIVTAEALARAEAEYQGEESSRSLPCPSQNKRFQENFMVHL